MGRNSKWVEGRPDDSTDRVARRALAARLERMWYYLERAVSEPLSETENVHQLRVFSRRADSALEIFAAWLPPRRGKWVSKQVKRVRKAAGEARDFDVLDLRWAELTELPAPTIELLLEQVRSCRRAAQEPINAVHARLLLKRFEHRTKRFLKRIGSRRDASAPSESFGCVARAALAGLAVPYLQAARAEMADAEALHAFRIQGKQVRYAMEVFAGAFEAPFRDELYPLVATLQDRLGAINDHVTAQAYLAQWRDATEWSDLRQALEAGIEYEQGAFDACRREFLDWWTRDRQEDLRRAFARHVPLEAESDGRACPDDGAR